MLIVGATGGTGREIVRQALARSYEVTVLVRDARTSAFDSAVTVIEGDVLNRAQVDRAVAGQDAVLCALGHRRFYSPFRVLSRGTATLIASMRNAGVERLVAQTALGIGDAAFRLGLSYTFFVIPVVLPVYFWDKRSQEILIERSGLDWTIVRPSVLTNGVARGRVSVGAGAGGLLFAGSVTRADVASLLLDQLASRENVTKAIGVSGR